MAKKEAKGQKKVHKVMSEFKEGTLHSGSKHGPVVTSKEQAVAIALSEARKAGARIPKKTKHTGEYMHSDMTTGKQAVSNEWRDYFDR